MIIQRSRSVCEVCVPRGPFWFLQLAIAASVCWWPPAAAQCSVSTDSSVEVRPGSPGKQVTGGCCARKDLSGNLQGAPSFSFSIWFQIGEISECQRRHRITTSHTAACFMWQACLWK